MIECRQSVQSKTGIENLRKLKHRASYNETYITYINMKIISVLCIAIRCNDSNTCVYCKSFRYLQNTTPNGIETFNKCCNWNSNLFRILPRLCALVCWLAWYKNDVVWNARVMHRDTHSIVVVCCVATVCFGYDHYTINIEAEIEGIAHCSFVGCCNVQLAAL